VADEHASAVAEAPPAEPPEPSPTPEPSAAVASLPLEEKARRKPEWRDGILIPLGNGESWVFPRPLLRFEPEDGEDGRLRFGDFRTTSDEAYDSEIETFLTTEDATEQAVSLLNLAAALLRQNYSLTTSDLRRLLPRVNGSETNAQMWNWLAEIALGRSGPKVTTDGSAAP
jgi:hypothetical protein